MKRVVVVGGSAAGLAAAESLRREGYDGAISIVDAEEHPPYDRPPLSKGILDGTRSIASVHLRQPADLDAIRIDWRLGIRAVEVDLQSNHIDLADGERLPFDGLVIATGVASRRLPAGHEIRGVHTLRTLSDAIDLREGLLAGRRLVVVGGGFLGLEVAAQARCLGLDVTIVEPLPTPVFRQLGPQIGRLLFDLHRNHGVDILVNVGVHALIGGTDFEGVQLADGRVVEADVCLVAVGSQPNVEWLAGSGLDVSDGVLCDSTLAAVPGVVVAGDVARWWHPGLDRSVRVEHRMNATEQGMAAARTLLGRPAPFAPTPYFWTDQYDAKLQVYGLPTEGAEFQLEVGNVIDGKFAGTFYSEGRSVAVLAWNMPKEARQLRTKLAAAPAIHS